MELRGYGKNMIFSNDPRHIVKIMRNNCAFFKYANYYKKIIKYGYFINSPELNGDGVIINYNNAIKITVGNLINDIPEPLYHDKTRKPVNCCRSIQPITQVYSIIYSQSPYNLYINTKIDHDGTMTQKKEYYAPGIEYKYYYDKDGVKNDEKKDVFIQIFLCAINELGNVIYNAKTVDRLPVSLQEMGMRYTPYISLNDMLND